MNEKIKELCSKCEYHIHCQGKGCAFRSLGNEYCDEVENANNLINDLQQRIGKVLKIIETEKKIMGYAVHDSCLLLIEKELKGSDSNV